MWIGARFDPKFGEHRWIDGSAMNVNGWFSGRPNVQGCVDYLDRIPNTDESEYYLWNSHIDCVSTRGPFICEKGKQYCNICLSFYILIVYLQF